MGEGHSFLWVHIIPGLSTLPDHVACSIIVLFIIFCISINYWLKTRKIESRLSPSPRMNLCEIMDSVITTINNLFEQVMGSSSKKYLPLVGSLFIYILLSNLIGLIPGLIPPTSNISTNFAISIIVFLLYNVYGFKENGSSYLRHFVGPVLALSWLIFPIEILSHLVRPVSLSVRLMGNMFGDHMVLSIFSNLMPVGIPIIFLALGAFVSLIQALVFTLLSTIYIALSTTHEHV